jgi:hypothetical protein
MAQSHFYGGGQGLKQAFHRVDMESLISLLASKIKITALLAPVRPLGLDLRCTELVLY